MNSPGKSTPQAQYKYEKLASLKSGVTVNVYGIVKFVKPVHKSRGSDYNMMISLIDDTLHQNDQKLKCLLFHREEDKLPYLQIGNIVRLHRLKIALFGGQLQGQSGPGFSWLVFDSHQGASLDPISSSSVQHTKTGEEKTKIEELRDWYAMQDTSELINCCTLADIIPQSYFDLYCQVLATCCIEENTCFLLRVWDGTKPIYPLRDFDLDTEECIVLSKPALLQRAEGFVVDVALYDDHFKTGSKIQAGQYIKLCNLHAPVYKSAQVRQDLAALPRLELVIHRGTSYGRGVCILSEDIPEIKHLRERLDRVAPSPTKKRNNESVQSCSNQSPDIKRARRQLQSKSDDNEIGSDLDHNETGIRNRSKLNKSCGITTQSSGHSDVVDDTSRCMLQTITVVVNHPHVKCTKIRDIMDHPVPFKFRILGYVADYYPKPQVAEDIIKLYCSECQLLQSVPTHTDKDTNSKAKSSEPPLVVSKTGRRVTQYFCPNCTSQHKDDKKELEYIFLIRFLIKDKTGWLVAHLWKKDAVTFFKDILPIEAMSSDEDFNDIRRNLQCLTGQDYDSQSPSLFECCVKSYHGKEGTHFQIFDTCFV